MRLHLSTGTGLDCVRRFVDGGYKASIIARHEGRLATWTDEISHTAPFPSDIMDIEKYRDTLVQIRAEHGVPKVIVCYASLATLTLRISSETFAPIHVSSHDSAGLRARHGGGRQRRYCCDRQ